MLFQLVAALVLTLVPHPTFAETIAGRASVVDGETLEIRSIKIRLHGVDAPESGQSCLDAAGQSYRCGQKAALALSDKIGAGNLSCEVLDVDRYGRSVARCMASSTNINGWIISQGWALAYRDYSTEYVPAEEAARLERRGIWQGTFDPPWDWRKQQTTRSASASAPAQAGCAIKGNISNKGERIYHSPGQQHYERTVISPDKGERWFCSVNEAVAAGWRPARR